MKKLVLLVLTAGFLSLGSFGAHACTTSDWVAGVGLVSSDSCTSGSAKNTEITNAVNGWLFGDWDLTGKYEFDEAATEVGTFSVYAGSSGYDYGWSFASSELSSFSDALFVVKQASKNQGNNWSAYYFSDLQSSSGYFNVDANLHGNGFSHVRMYTRGSSHSVPEIDAAGAAIALALMAGILGLRRELKVRQMQKLAF